MRAAHGYGYGLMHGGARGATRLPAPAVTGPAAATDITPAVTGIARPGAAVQIDVREA